MKEELQKLIEIINCNDYEQITNELRAKTEEIATIIRKKMKQLDIVDEMINVANLNLKIVSGRTNVGYYEYLALCDDYDVLYCIDGQYDGFVHGDFNVRAIKATNEMCIDFLNKSKEIIVYLGDVENELVKKVKEAIRNAAIF